MKLQKIWQIQVYSLQKFIYKHQRKNTKDNYTKDKSTKDDYAKEKCTKDFSVHKR